MLLEREVAWGEEFDALVRYVQNEIPDRTHMRTQRTQTWGRTELEEQGRVTSDLVM